MALSKADDQDTHIGNAALADRIVELRRCQRQMLQLVSSAGSKSDLIRRYGELIHRFAEPVAMFYFERNEEGSLAVGIQLYPAEVESRSERFANQLSAACQAACRQGEVEVRQQAAPARIIIAAPVVLRGRDPEAFGVIFPTSDSLEQLLMLVQMAATHFVLWHVLADGRDSQADTRDLAALVELLEKVDSSPDLRHACCAVAGELQTYLQCARVAVGVRRAGKGRCRLAAISGVAHFDKCSQTARAIEAAMDEAVLCDEITAWPPGENRQHAALCHKSLCSLDEANSAFTVPLRDHDGAAIGALTLLDKSAERTAHAERFMRPAERPLATSLGVIERLEGGRIIKLCRVVSCFWRTWKGKSALAAVILLSAMMAIPLPFKIHCDCQIEPVTRRFVAAPFEGTLEKAFVRPGDVVSENELLARMDGREIRWKRASVVADRNQAVKKRDAAQAAHKFADAQIAMLETERLDLQLRLLDHRAENLEIRSPVAGIVASGDLERAEGAPLTIGQTLFEIAPLEKMIVEVAVADEDVSFVHAGQSILVRLDAYPGETWQSVVMKVQPRSEIRKEDNVFIAEAELDNDDGRLRPGMRGRAKVQTPRRPLGWILFHKPWEFLTKKLSW